MAKGATLRSVGPLEDGTLPLSKIRQTQDERVSAFVEHAYRSTVYYRAKLGQLKIKPGSIKGVADLRRIPPTRYTSEMPAEELLAVPWDKVANILTTSGTTGQPKVIYLSEADLERWKMQFARLAASWGIGKGDVVMAGFPFPAVFDGLVVAGAAVLPFTHVSLLLDNQLRQLERLKVTAIFSGPASFLAMVKRAREMGVDLKGSELRLGILGGETWSQSFRRRMEADLGMKFYDVYGSVEVGHPAAECTAQDGMHIWEDLYVVEILDIETQEPVPEGTYGEVVVTPLWRDAMPLIRYRTGDVAAIQRYERCGCGRTFPRMSRIKGRIDHMVRVGSVTVFPSDVEEVLQAAPECSGEFQIVVERPEPLDSLQVKAECSLDETPSAGLRKKLEADLLRAIGAECEVELVYYGALAKGPQFKGQRVVRG
ncbi:MAG: AMP-binding protein [Chloroflexota bacterium]